MVDTRDLKSLGQKCPYGFESRPKHRKGELSGSPFLCFGRRHLNPRRLLPATPIRGISRLPGAVPSGLGCTSILLTTDVRWAVWLAGAKRQAGFCPPAERPPCSLIGGCRRSRLGVKRALAPRKGRRRLSVALPRCFGRRHLNPRRFYLLSIDKFSHFYLLIIDKIGTFCLLAIDKLLYLPHKKATESHHEHGNSQKPD